MLKRVITFALAICAQCSFAYAYDGQMYGTRTPAVSAREAFDRTQAVLAHYNVPEEEDPSIFLLDVQNAQSIEGLKKLLPYMDPNKVFPRLAKSTQTELSVFQDIDSKEVLDTKVNLKPTDEVVQYHIGDPTQRTPQYPLNGLRVALDPGHMGGHEWDVLTGKYVHDKQGHVVSEGTTVLQISILLKDELEKLGAKVLLTRTGQRPAAKEDYKTFDLAPYALNELRESIHEPWFQKLIRLAPAGPQLFKLFDSSANIKSIFSDKQRANYFISRVDLAARSDMINDFKPDIALIIHMDVAVSRNDIQGLNPSAPLETKTFVMGAYEPTEFASRADRKYFVNHLLDVRSWNLSLNLSRNIVQKFNSEMGLGLSRQKEDGWTVVEPGIISRNLGVSRRLKVPAVSYLECLFYNRPEEFKALNNTTHPMLIDGVNVPYSDRVVQMVQTIKNGILEFAKNN